MFGIIHLSLFHHCLEKPVNINAYDLHWSKSNYIVTEFSAECLSNNKSHKDWSVPSDSQVLVPCDGLACIKRQ